MTQPTDKTYVRYIAALAVAIHQQDFQGHPFKELKAQDLDALGADSKVFRKRRVTLMSGYDWRIATDVAIYEALQAIGLLPSSI